MSTSVPRRSLATFFLLTLLSADAFQARAQQTIEINTGAANDPLYAVGPVYVSSTLFYRYSRFAYLYTQDELAAAGILPGNRILGVGWMKSTSHSAAGPAVFSIYMKNSSAAAYSAPSVEWTALSAGAAQVYTESAQSIPATASPNYIDFTLTAPFMYTGGSLEILTEWDISAAPAPIATGSFEWVNTTVVDRIYASGNTSLPATLSSTDNNISVNDRRPVIQFTVDPLSGIGEEMAAKIGLWPNPADHIVTISNGTGEPFGRIEVINALGRVVLIDDSPRSAAANHQLDLGQLAAGQYLVGIHAKAGRVMKRVTVK
ncbi:MAG: T9SS type A sorting domain-containing protein [Flavobacteriales bacterium]|nr:T9SS type A sorting domain-containing protein [Flavobacteriales bacterium]